MTTTDITVRPFHIHVPQTDLDDLRARLARTRVPDTVEGADWAYGVNHAYLTDLLHAWQHHFDWRAQESRLNRLRHFQAFMDGQMVHFVHERAREDATTVTPLVLLHGWPSTFVQFEALIPLLTTPDEHGAAFDVIAVSLPGYGFSGRPTRPGMGSGAVANLIHTLVTRELGYDRYVVRASDIAWGVARHLALRFPQAVRALHLSGTIPMVAALPDDLTDAERVFVANVQLWTQTEGAYAMEHATKPQTPAFALNDSPAGLAAWIMEKFHAWGDHHGDVNARYGRDALLTNLTIYWVTQTIGSSMRFYYECMRDFDVTSMVRVPTGMLMAPKDMFPTPREWIARSLHLTHWTETQQGAHFLEWEEPALVDRDLRVFLAGLTGR